MISIAVLAGWSVIGLIVAAIEKSLRREHDVDGTTITVVCVAGALAGAFVGQTLRLFVFGQPAGFLFAAGGAKLLLELYRSRRSVARSGNEPPRSAAASASVASAPPREIPLGTRLGDAFGWGIACAVAVAISGFLSHLAGSFVYPQRYEQIPSDFVFVPLGLILGFLTAAIASVTRPHWRGTPMLGVIIVASVVYASFMFEYARGRAIGAGLTITFDPDPGVPVRCETAACPQADPPLEWMVQGTLRVQETNGMGATVNAISMYSSDMSAYSPGPRKVTRAEAIERSRFDGPRVRFEGGEINGARHVRAHDVVSYPITYFYRTRRGEPHRNVAVYVEFTDTARRSSVSVGEWKVR